MCSADEVALVDTVNGTSRCTRTASGTLIVIDNGEVVDHLDSTHRTGLLALAAGDTAVLTALADSGTLIVVRALYYDALGILDKVDDTVGALSCAHTAADALSGIYPCNTIVDGDRILRTNAHAIAVAEAGEGAKLVSGVVKVCNTTALNTVVYESALGSRTVTVAGNVRNLLNNVSRLDTEDSRDVHRALVAAGNAEVSLIALAVCKRLCISVASGISASTAVSSGKAVTDSEEGLVLLDREEDVCNGKDHGTKNTDARKKQNSI